MKKMGLKFELTSEGYIGLAIVYDAAASKFPVHTTRKLNNFFQIILCLKIKNEIRFLISIIIDLVSKLKKVGSNQRKINIHG